MASTLKDAARKGVWGDTRLGHLSNGDRVFPAEKIDEHTAKQIDVFMRKHGLDPGRFTVGHKSNARNPHTRLPMFADGGGDPGGAGGDPGGGGGDPSGGGDASGGGETGGGANAAGTGGNIGGAGPGDNSGGSETGGGANAPGTGGNIGGAGPGGTSTGGANSLGGEAAAAQGAATSGTPTGGPSSLGGEVAAAQGAATPAGQKGTTSETAVEELTTPNVSAVPSITGLSFLDTMLQGFLSHPIQSAIDLGVGMIPGIGLANTALGALSSLTGGATPTAGSMATSAGRAIGDAFSGSGGLSGTGGTGPSPTGGAGGSAGLTGASAPSMGANSLVQAINNTPSVAAPAAAAAPAPSSAAAPPLGGGVGVPLTDMLFNTYRL